MAQQVAALRRRFKSLFLPIGLRTADLNLRRVIGLIRVQLYATHFISNAFISTAHQSPSELCWRIRAGIMWDGFNIRFRGRTAKNASDEKPEK